MGMRCFCSQAQKQVDKSKIYLAISIYSCCKYVILHGYWKYLVKIATDLGFLKLCKFLSQADHKFILIILVVNILLASYNTMLKNPCSNMCNCVGGVCVCVGGAHSKCKCKCV